MHSFVKKHPPLIEEGFTLLELLVSMSLGLIVLALGLSTLLTNKYVLSKELARTRITQSLRGALDIVGTDVRIGGENLGSGFPAIEVTNGASGAPDTLIVRRNLIDEVLPLCTDIAAASSGTSIVFANTSAVAGCAYSGHTNDYNAWRTYRTTHDNEVDAYIFNTATKQGEFFTYTGEADSGTAYAITKKAGVWQYAYTVGATSSYILEEWRYQLVNGVLQIVENRDTANPYNIAFDVTNFQVTVKMADGTTKTAFTATDAWSQIEQINITISGSENFNGRTIAKTVTGKFFPRNVLSN